MRLEYSVTRPYTLPNLTTYVSVVSGIAIVGLAVLNFALQGYERVTVLRPNPNVTESYWWTPGLVKGWHSAGNCDPISLSRRMTFRTNSSLFTYDLRSTFDSSGDSVLGATPYMANPLGSCVVEGILVSINTNRQTFKFDTPVRCTGSSLPFSLSLTSPFIVNPNPYYDDISTYYTANKAARVNLQTGSSIVSLNASSPTNIIGILDALSTDLQLSMTLAVSATAGARPTLISTGGLWACPGGEDATCNPEDMTMTIPRSQTDYSNGSTVVDNGPGPFVGMFEKPLLNMLIALKDAYHIDFGNVQSSNTLLNKGLFDKIMQVDSTISNLMQSNPDDKICTSGLGCLGGMPWVQRLLTSDASINVTVPTLLPGGNAPTVVRMDYLCPSYKLKSIGSLLSSVFIGTWSMYMALFAVFGFFGPMLERRYGKGKEGDAVVDQTAPELGYSHNQGVKNPGGYLQSKTPGEGTPQPDSLII